jgi:hypothetical protein
MKRLRQLTKDFELEYEDELLLVLEFIVISQMMAETNQMDFNYYGNLSPVKPHLL